MRSKQKCHRLPRPFQKGGICHQDLLQELAQHSRGNAGGISLGSVCRQHPQVLCQVYFMPSSGLHEQAGQIDQENEKCQEKGERGKKITRYRGYNTGEFRERV